MVMDSDTGLIRDSAVTVSRDTILRRLGIRPASYEPSKTLRRIYRETVSSGYEIIAPAVSYRRRDIAAISEGEILFHDTPYSLQSAVVARHMRGCRQVTLLVATVGEKIGREIARSAAAGRMTEAMILDAFGSEAVEEVVNQFCSRMKKIMSGKGYGPVRRFSPGYGDWALHAQDGILKEVGADAIGVSCTADFILKPEKSITAVVGWKKEGEREECNGVMGGGR